MKSLLRLGGLVAFSSLAIAAASRDVALTFVKGSDIRNSDAPMSLIMGEWNDDGLPDLAITNYYDNSLQIALGLGNGNFIMTAAKVPVGAYPNQMAAGDWNEDGLTDLAITNSDEDSVSILLNRSKGVFEQTSKLSVGIGPVGIAVGEWSRDRHLDLAVVNRDSATLTFLLGNGRGDFQLQAPLSVPGSSSLVVSGDWNGDRTPDFAIAGGPTSGMVFFGVGDSGSLEAKTALASLGPISAAASADLNADRVDDLVTAGTTGLWVHLSKAKKARAESHALPLTGEVSHILVQDLDQDGYRDLVVALRDQHQIALFRGLGNGRFEPGPRLSSGPFPTSIGTADLDRDGRTDLVVANRGGKGLMSFMNIEPVPAAQTSH